MNLTRTLAGLGLAALLSVTAACGSDDADEKDANQGDQGSAQTTTATPQGASTLFLQATVDLDHAKLCSLMVDGDKALKDDPKLLEECTETFKLFLPADDEETKKQVAEAEQGLKDGPSKVEELTPTTAEVSYAAVADGTPTALTKVGDEWLVNLSGE